MAEPNSNSSASPMTSANAAEPMRGESTSLATIFAADRQGESQQKHVICNSSRYPSSHSRPSYRLLALSLVALLFSVGCSAANESEASCAADTKNNDGDDQQEQQPTTLTPEMVAQASSWSSPDAKDPDAVISLDGYKPPPYESVHDLSDFIMPTLRPGELKMLRWNDGEKNIVQNFAARIGLPKHTMAVLRKYAADLGMLEEMRRTHYKEPLEPDTGRFHVTPAVNSGGHELKWYIQRPGKHYESDLHWFGCGDERTHESFLRALADAGLDTVLDAIGEEYDLDGLAIQGVGFLSATHADVDGFIHYDWSKTGGRAFNILIPLEQVPGSGPELYVSDDEDNGEIKFHPSYGLLLGDDSYHGTHECDHRHTGKIRASVTIYLADLTRQNVEIVAADPTAVFPLPKSAEWLWTQRGRHWGDGKSLVDDVGRNTWQPVDLWDDCAERAAKGLCEVSNAHEMRQNCAVTCNVYMTDEEYQLGVPRKKVFY